MEHCTLELPFSPSDQAKLYLKGPHTLHLTGFLDMDEEDDWNEMDEEKAMNGKAGADDDDDDDDEEDDDDYDEMEGEEEDDDEDDDDDEGEEEDDEEDDEDEDDEVVVAPSKRPAPAAAPPGKKQKGAAPPPAAPPAKKAKGAAAPVPAPAPAAEGGPNTWTKDEVSKFNKALAQFPEGSDARWDKVAQAVGSRNKQQCKKRAKGGGN